MKYEDLKHWIQENTVRAEDYTDVLLDTNLKSNHELAWRLKGARELGKEILARWPGGE